MKFDWQHWLLLVGAPTAVCFVETLLGSGQPFSRSTLEHAATAAAFVFVTLFKKTVLTQGGAS